MAGQFANHAVNKNGKVEMRFISLNRSSDEMGDFRQVEEI